MTINDQPVITYQDERISYIYVYIVYATSTSSLTGHIYCSVLLRILSAGIPTMVSWFSLMCICCDATNIHTYIHKKAARAYQTYIRSIN